MTLLSARRAALLVGPPGRPGSPGPPGQAGASGGSATGTGFVRIILGATQPAASAVNLAGADVTGLLPPTSMGIITGSGDVTGNASGGTIPLVVTRAQSGVLTFGTSGLITVGAGFTGAGITQTIAASDVATNGVAFTAQSAFAAATTHLTGGNITLTPGAGATTNGAPGNAVIGLGAPSGSGAEALVQVMRGGTPRVQFGALPGIPAYGAAWFGNAVATATNYTITSDASSQLAINGPTFINFSVNGTSYFCVGGSNGMQIGGGVVGNTTQFAGGAGVVGLGNATTAPSSNPAGGGVLYANAAAATWRGANGAVTTLAASGSSGTVTSQAQISDQTFGTCETVSSATPTIILPYSTLSGKGGTLQLTVLSRATTTGTGIVVGDTASALYFLTFRNIGGTVTLSTAGITLITGTNQTTVAALTAPVLTATVATNVITIKVTNVALCTVDSQVEALLVVN